MNCILFMLLFTLQIYDKVPFAFGKKEGEKCLFDQTVNLTNHQLYENGSYIYQGIIIPPERQQIYKYILNVGGNKTVIPHLRGCACDKKPCIKLCCAEDEFLNAMDTSRCEKLRKNMNVSWNVPLRQRNGSEKIKNIFQHFIYQVGLPCDYPEELLEEDRAILFEDGTLYIQEFDTVLSTTEYCYSPRFHNISQYILSPFSCPFSVALSWAYTLNKYAFSVSTLFLLTTIVVYLMLKELRRSLSGKILFCYLFCSTIGNAIIGFINISDTRFDFISCCLLGFTSYFFFMAAFFWLSVVCFDMWKSFDEANIELDSHRNLKYLIIYSLYAWLGAGVATGSLIYLEASPDVDKIYKPDIGNDICWLNMEKFPVYFYFYIPNLIVVIFNIVTFARLLANVYSVKKNMAKRNHNPKLLKKNTIVFWRLLVALMVASLGFIDIILACLSNASQLQISFVLSDLSSALHGIMLFSTYILRSKVLNLLKRRVLCIFHKTAYSRQH